MRAGRRARVLLEGAIDMHVHPAPSRRPRLGDAWDLAVSAAKLGMGGILLKDHDRCTVADAAIVGAHARAVRTYSSVCCNEAVGGLNLGAVQAALDMGAAMVFLPTTSAGNDHDFWKSSGVSTPPGRSLSVLDDGGLSREVKAILEACHRAGAAVGTGHLGTDEITAVVEAAADKGVNVIVTHAPVFTEAASDVLAAWAAEGALIELAAAFCCAGPTLPAAVTRDPEADAAIIEAIGAESIVLSSDLGWARAVPPVDGLALYVDALGALGVGEAALRQMLHDNPVRVLAEVPE